MKGTKTLTVAIIVNSSMMNKCRLIDFFKINDRKK